jgi:ubiquinone/menaquinone biosynthesis C-methylase UbiE
MSESVNAEAIEAWNTVLFEKFMRFRIITTRGLAVHGDAALARLALSAGARVLDLGCGMGDTTLAIARTVGESGEAVGVDAAARFLEVARSEAAAAGLPTVRFRVADVQAEDLGGPFDAAFSRFGTMFFASPVIALRNVARALVPGGRLMMAVWRRREDNDWLHAAERVVRELLPEEDKGDQVTCGPGPFSMADADLVSTVMQAAGYRDVNLERHDAPICVGHDLDEAVEFAVALGPAGELIRLAGEEGQRLRPRIEEALRGVFADLQDADGRVHAGSSVWLVSGCTGPRAKD